MAVHEAKEPLVVGGHSEVGELVDEHVLEAGCGLLDERRRRHGRRVDHVTPPARRDGPAPPFQCPAACQGTGKRILRAARPSPRRANIRAESRRRSPAYLVTSSVTKPYLC